MNSVLTFISLTTLLQLLTFLLKPLQDDACSPALLNLFLAYDVYIWLTVWNSNPDIDTVPIDFHNNSNSFHRTALDYSPAAWDGFLDHIRDVL